MAYVLPPEIEQWVSAEVLSGRYANEREVLKAAIHALEDKRLFDELEAELRSNGYEEIAPANEDDDDWPAIKAALDGIEDGTNKPMSVQEAFDRIREQHGVS